jgi:lipopolysaccharide/colanic/teichoic acid biosynthesis glycosyltransferase
LDQPVVGVSVKHLGNFAAACALILLTLPLMALVALAIRCESCGPVFERRPRLAPGGRRFDLLTFRTTACDPDCALPSWAQPTGVGSFLRYTRIDALPRLINALRGEISFFEAHGWPTPLWD